MSTLPDPAGETIKDPADNANSEDSSLHDPAQTHLDTDQTGAWTHGEVAPTMAVDGQSLPGTEPGVAGGQPVDRPPQRVAGYDILGVLGRGGMGVVYRARQPGLKRIVALKMIVAGAHASVDEVVRFRAEAEAVASLQHPNIVQIYEVGKEDGWPFFSLEFVDGESLAKKTGGIPQPPPEAAVLVRTLAQAVEYAHQHGIIHRDLKPANILLTREGVPKVADFGLAKQLEDDSTQTRTGCVLGTPSYMAPEQAEGRIKDVGARADVYALGAILYELLTGRPPFRGASVYDTLDQVRRQEPVAPSQLQPKLPVDLETICLKCLQKDPDKRYPSAQALADDLGRFVDGQPILARPVSSVERCWRWCRRNPRNAGLSAAVIILLVVWAISSSLLAARLAREKQATASAAALALVNAKRANDKAAEASRNADAAETSAREARAQAKRADEQKARAERNDTSARTVAHISLDRLVRVGGMVRKHLPTTRDDGPNARQLRQLRQDFDALLKQTVSDIAQNTGVQRSDPERLAAVLQQLGDLQMKMGQGQEAARHFQRAFELLEKHAIEHPEDDRAQANVGSMLVRLGDSALELNGDAAGAERFFSRAVDVQRAVQLHPRSGFYSALDHTRLLSHYARKRGVAWFHRGDPATAARWIDESVARRRAWLSAEPASIPAVSFLAEALMWAGTTACHSGARSQAEARFAEALAIYDTLTQRFPRSSEFLGDQATIVAAYADALLRWDARDGARQAFERALRGVDSVLAHDADDAEKKALRATLFEGLAALAQREGKEDDAQARYRVALSVREELADLEPQNLPAAIRLIVALARCGQVDNAVRRAEALAPRVSSQSEQLTQLAWIYAVCAGQRGGKENQYLALAFDYLKGAIQRGYRDAVALRTDVDLTALQRDPRMQSLLTELGTP